MVKNEYLRKLKAQQAAEMRHQRMVAVQFCTDAAVIAANEVFNRRGEKLVEFMTTFMERVQEIASMTVEDAKGDKSLEYTKAKVDGVLKDLLGESFVPWEERYKF